ncbi:MAG TPA: hypothetical protein VFD33_00380 [Bacillota bacterium]|nr:hypothetical protein [Bacillota bacterium]
MDRQIYSSDRKTHAKILLVYRIGVLFFASILTLERWLSGSLSGLDQKIIIAYGIFQLIVPLFYLPAILSKALPMFAFADIVTASLVVFYTGGISSPLVACCFISIFALHFLWGIRGLIHGMVALFSSLAAIFFIGGIQLEAIWLGAGVFNILSIGLFIITAYIIPCIAVRKYYYLTYSKKGLEERLEDMDDINTRLLLLFEMMGRMSYEAGLNQNVEKILLVVKEVFASKRACLSLIVNGELYNYGQTTREEKAEIYSLIGGFSSKDEIASDHKNGDFAGSDDSILVPVMSGTKLDGVLCLFGLVDKRISGREAILITVATNAISSYIHNLEYLESVSFHRDTSVKISQLDSGKAVKGVLDKRIVTLK